MDSQPKTRSRPPRAGGRPQWPGIVGFGLTALATLVSLGALFSILGYLIIHGIGAINWSFLVKEPAAVGESGGGIAPSLLGTAILVTISSIIGVPLGIGVGVYLSELAGDNPFASFTRLAINTFIGVPSIITGIFVYFVMVKPTNTFSAVAGGLALGIIMIPIMARTTEDVLRLVPESIREGGLALGASQWQVTMGLVLPAARSGVITGGVLAIARVAGETAPLILTALGNEYYPSGLFHPIDEITLRILKYARGPYDVWHQQAYGAALLLVLGVAIGGLLLRLTTRDYNAQGRQ
jgi:phosphate transport system permease protein